MDSISDIAALAPGRVLYHSAFGLAVIVRVEAEAVTLSWPDDAPERLPTRVTIDVVRRVYAMCAPGGFFHRAAHEAEALVDSLIGRPLEALFSLLSDLDEPQSIDALVDWVSGPGPLSPNAARRWADGLAAVVSGDARFVLDGETIALADANAPASGAEAVGGSDLPPARRLELALAHRSALAPEAFLAQVVDAMRDGTTAVRDRALDVLDGTSPDDLIARLLSNEHDSIEAVIHAIRRAGWGPADAAPHTHASLLDRIVRGCDIGGPLDHEGRLAATLVRWNSPGVADTLADLAYQPDGRRLIRATLSALPSRRGEALGLELLTRSIQDAAPDTAEWLGGEVLSSALVDNLTLADRIEDDRPELADWFRDVYQGVEATGLQYDELTDESTAFTAELELSGTTTEPIPLGRLPARSGASLIGLGLSIARALAAHHKDGVICNPTDTSVFVLPSEAMEVTPAPAVDLPLLTMETPSPSTDVHLAAVLLLQCMFGRPWPSHIAAHRAVPYLRYVVPQLPPASLAALDAALHPNPAMRPASALEWLALWQVAAIAEEKRSYAMGDPSAKLEVGFDSHIGRHKVLLTQTNQDSLYVSTKGPLSLLCVCDGISTANAGSGDIASSIASSVVANLWDQALPRVVEADPAQMRDFLDRALRMANQAICEAALRFAGGDLAGRVPMGTTIVVALVYGNRVWLTWLGDSRAYLVGPYGASLLTFDENQASERLRAWQMRFNEQWDPAGYALIGYLGHFDEMGRADALPAHHGSFTMVPGERLVLCTDGVTDYIADSHPETASAVATALNADDPDECARNLIAAANRGGGGDNITAVVAALARS